MSKDIQYSRHANRRMKLYSISQDDILSVIEEKNPELEFSQGKHEIIGKNVCSQDGYPIKVVFSCERDKIVIITAYPLKKGRKQ